MLSSRVMYRAAVLLSIASACFARSTDYEVDEDLHRFVTRPDLRPPKFNVSVYDESSITPGYWFVAPYADLFDRASSRLFQPGQVGPHIYDGSGNLVWSGAQLFGDRTTFDFKTAICDSGPCMSLILKKDRLARKLHGGAGILMDTSYNIKDIIQQTAGNEMMNMHEFTITEQGTALMITFRAMFHEVTATIDESNHGQDRISGWFGNNGFREIEISTGDTLFEWWALDHVDPYDSLVSHKQMPGSPNSPWDFFHLNSIDKSKDGDYLISSRYLNSIYKISKLDGSIIWQLGGVKSSIELHGFNFSSQHDARFRHENSTHTVIALFNNAADDHTSTASMSSAMVISIDHTERIATLVSKLNRPDLGLTHLRGNVQKLPNSNTLVCWSENGHISEFNEAGSLLLDAQFSSHRFVTYRGYKFNLTAQPAEDPVLKSFVYGAAPKETSVTSIYVSWNGATEVASWRFYGLSKRKEEPQLLGKQQKSGFETVLMVPGTICKVYAEAMSQNGTVLGLTDTEYSTLPPAWDSSICHSTTTTDMSDATTTTSSSWSKYVHHFSSPTVFYILLPLCCGIVMVTFRLWLALRISPYVTRKTNLDYDLIQDPS